jgi:hypothetical protein
MNAEVLWASVVAENSRKRNLNFIVGEIVDKLPV